ncbi:hypothetical protein KW855_004314 [Salmonella enterica]|nr:hypothetical protein [Salmonella enterica]ECX3460473.1 hypothetical protein [Salmonella enterica subsp. enterica serovar Litchfield]EDC0265944.1 hypothetical protein [Salmonella enterica subsp. enterica serovar Newport]EEJ2961755.1 hypothetical protein [Salmonella enterica subsp. enterica serovar Daytona]ELS8778836.1 hypothetical protein [Salmonella enterica subsp. enterica serovar Carrau]EAX5841865.1 hypothetical protein [Salmonella enterica]
MMKVFVVILLMAAATLLIIHFFEEDDYSKAQLEINKVLYNKIKDCKLLEVAHYNGFWEAKTNKLDCNGVIYNISTSDYDNAMNSH